MVWHFLKFDKEIDSTRTEEELRQLKRDTVALIDRIENAETFPCRPSALCDWCEFKPLCKHWAHLYKLREKPENEYLNDSGVQLVNRYAALKKKKSQMNHNLSSEIEQVEEALSRFAEKEHVDVVFGDKNKVRIKEYERYRFPSKHSKRRNELIDFLKKQDKWEKVNQLDTSVLNKILLKNPWNDDVLDMLKEFVELDRTKRLYVSKMRD